MLRPCRPPHPARCRTGRRTTAPIRHVPKAAATAPPEDPFAKITEYKDSAVDKLFIKLFTKKMAAQLTGVYVPDEPEYDDFVRVSKEIMKGRNPEQQKLVVGAVLTSLMPENTPAVFKRLFPPTQLSAEINAYLAAVGFSWLVGEMEVREGEVEVEPGKVQVQRSIVHIKKCRYLENSACVGMCVNMCKVPTQDFFTESFGLPLTMKPNFEDLSCDMIFGQMPPPVHEDEALRQPCFATKCSIANTAPTAHAPPPCPRTTATAPAMTSVAAA